MRKFVSLAAAGGMLTLAGLVSAAVPAGAATTPGQSLTRTTQVVNHGDSGTQGDLWGTEQYALKATVTRADSSQYDPATFCGTASTDTGKCYKWLATETFSNGSFTTTPGAASPRTGAVLGVAATGPFTGWVKGIVFYSSWKGVYARDSRVPASRNDGGTKGSGDYTVSRWPALFFGSAATVNVADFGDGVVSTYWFKYTLPFGSDSQCPNVASQWVDSVPGMNDGAKVTAGDILAPASAGGCTS
jgi:hypothetical protein